MAGILKPRLYRMTSSFILVLSIFVGMMSPAMATSGSYTLHTNDVAANTLNALGLLAGNGNGYDLLNNMTRVEGAIMLVRLIGKEDEALAVNYTHPFTDVPAYAQKYIAYCYRNKLTYGISSSKYGTTQLMTANQYITFVLRALGYSDTAGDFNYKAAYKKALALELLADYEWDEINFFSTFHRTHMVVVSLNALFVNIKGTNTTLLAKLYGIDEAITLSQLEKDAEFDYRVMTYYETIKPKEPEPTPGTVEFIRNKLQKCVYSIFSYDCFGNRFRGGSGFCIDSAGTMVTCYSVIDMAQETQIYNYQNTRGHLDYVKAYDIQKDLTVATFSIGAQSYYDHVSIDRDGGNLADSACFAAGYPDNNSLTVTQGKILNPDMVVDGVHYILFNAPISSGCMGGPLTNANGEVIGIVYGTMKDGSGYVAISIDEYKNLTYLKYQNNRVSDISFMEYGIYYLYENNLPLNSVNRSLQFGFHAGYLYSTINTTAIVGSFNNAGEIDKYTFTLKNTVAFGMSFIPENPTIFPSYVPVNFVVTDASGKICGTSFAASSSGINYQALGCVLSPGTYTITVTSQTDSPVSSYKYLLAISYDITSWK